VETGDGWAGGGISSSLVLCGGGSREPRDVGVRFRVALAWWETSPVYTRSPTRRPWRGGVGPPAGSG
jgi:hypothetical protein